MAKNILFYHWGALGDDAVRECFCRKGIGCVDFSRKMQDYHADGEFAKEMLKVLHANPVDAVFSYDYFPLISMLCEMNKLPYVSWIYDCPMNTLMSGTLSNSCNYIFCFDAAYAQKLSDKGAVNVYHMPLGVEENTLHTILEKEKKTPSLISKYQSEISFVGNLYNGEKNRLRRAELSEYTKGYVEGLVKSQLLVYGYNLLSDSMKPEIVQEIVDKCDLKLSDKYMEDPVQMAADAVGTEVTAREREEVLKLLSSKYPFVLYSSSPVEEVLRGAFLQEKGFADYEDEMPFIFHNSKINLNITSRTIQSGIPKRVLDILACGGFCITNYQPEIAEYFEDGVELVMYTSIVDLIAKVEYYLSHDEERKVIAANGNRKVRKYFNLEHKIGEIIDEVLQL